MAIRIRILNRQPHTSLGEFARTEIRLNRKPFEPDPVNPGGGKRTIQVHQTMSRFSGFFCFSKPNVYGAAMEITVNGDKTTIEEMSVLSYLETLDIDPRRVAVELNLDILPKAEYETTVLSDGDRIEIVHFVGGGRL